MILDEASVPAYLVAKGLAAPSTAWTVSAAPSRNRNFSAAPEGGGPGFFLKQLRVTAPESLLMMQREATVYWLSRNDPDFAELAGLIPPFVLFDGAAKVLVLGLVSGSRNLLRHQEELGGFPVPLAESLGGPWRRSTAGSAGRWGAIRRAPPSRSRCRGSSPPTAAVPWSAGSDRGRCGSSSGCGRICSWRRPSTGSRPAGASTPSPTGTSSSRTAWCPPARTIPSGSWTGSWADFGDPCWDAGCIVQAYLYAGLYPFLGRRGERLRERLGQAGERGEALRAALRGFRRHCGSAGVERTMGCAGARLLQMALEVMHGQEEPPPAALSLLELGEEVLENPLEAAGLLGLGEGEVSAPSGAPRSGG